MAGAEAGDDASCLIVDPEVALQQCRELSSEAFAPLPVPS